MKCSRWGGWRQVGEGEVEGKKGRVGAEGMGEGEGMKGQARGLREVRMRERGTDGERRGGSGKVMQKAGRA